MGGRRRPLDKSARHKVFVGVVALLCSLVLLGRVRQRASRDLARELFPEDFAEIDQLPDRLELEEEAATVISQNSKPYVHPPDVIIYTGNAPSGAQVPPATGECAVLETELHFMWSAWSTKAYVKRKANVHASLKKIARAKTRCVLKGHGPIEWSFPLSYYKRCDFKTSKTLSKKTYLKEKTKVVVNWFLLRPDLVTLSNAAASENVRVLFEIYLTSDVSKSSFQLENCPRFATVLAKREIYKQRFLLSTASELRYQMSRLRKDVFNLHVVASTGDAKYGHHRTLEAIAAPVVDVAAAPTVAASNKKLVFVAGLEGVGHHLFSVLGKKRTTRALYEALTDHLCDSAWADDSEVAYDVAFTRLSNEMANAIASDATPEGIVFLNTVWSVRDVNMYSYPWGGPRCRLKRYARVLCNIDIVELQRAATRASIEFRVIALRRSIGAATVSASLHRPFGTLVSETKMLSASRALMEVGLGLLPADTVLDVWYEDAMNKPTSTADKLSSFLQLPPTSTLAIHFRETLTKAASEHLVGDGSRWKEEVDAEQLVFMSDLLSL